MQTKWQARGVEESHKDQKDDQIRKRFEEVNKMMSIMSINIPNDARGVEESHKDQKVDKIGKRFTEVDKRTSINIRYDLIVAEILPRLPPRSIFRFQSVCKSWRWLAYDRNLVRKHLQLFCKNPFKVLIFYLKNFSDRRRHDFSLYSLDVERNWETPKHLFRFLLDPVSGYVKQPSCNGLVCFSTESNGKIYLCNPSTRNLERIPTPKLPSSDLACTVDGFGFDQVSRRYKVLCGFYRLRFDNRKRYIFTLGTPYACLRQVEDMPLPMSLSHCGNAYLNGTVNWITENLQGILSFSFEDERYSVVALPNCNYQGRYLSLIVGGGHLHLIARETTAQFWIFQSWKLNDFVDQVWAYEFSFQVPRESSVSFPHALSIAGDNVLFTHEINKLYRYNLRTNVFQDIYFWLPGKFDFGASLCFLPHFVETLV